MDTTHLTTDPSNEQQRQTWDGDEGALWAAHAPRVDESLANYQGPFLAAAAIGERDRVLDVGCGTGQATRDVARIARRGSALGVDLSSHMIALARETAATEGLDNVEFQQRDAQVHPFAAESFDAVISRMGSMFFGDPVAAFANLRRALRPRGRLTLLTWQAIADNEWLMEFRAAVAVGRDLPTPPPDVQSPFSLSDPERVTTLLEAAAFIDVAFESVRAPMNLGADTEGVFDFVDHLTSPMRSGLDDAGHLEAVAALRRSIDDHTSDHGVTYDSAAWIVQARRR